MLVIERYKLGSIPAGAGEPPTCRPHLLRQGVDPRGCGGASLFVSLPATVAGRSPRVRGSLSGGPAGRPGSGSIPAGAGEPRPHRCAPPGRRVDPRGCGGAAAAAVSSAHPPGRSPRVRGSRTHAYKSASSRGSIPAGAGEPKQISLLNQVLRVDPRGCGGARTENIERHPDMGRSPRVRGSRKILPCGWA